MRCNQNAATTYRQLFGRYPTGVAVCLAGDADQAIGITVNSLNSVSLEPLLLSFCAASGSNTAKAIVRTGKFSVNLLTEKQEDVSRHFAGKPFPAAVNQLEWRDSYWSVSQANACFLCELEHRVPLGDHDLLVGRVVTMFGPEQGGMPLMYFQGSYARRALSL